MKLIKAIFSQLSTSDEMMLMGRYILIPLITLVLYYLILMILIRMKSLKPLDDLENFYLRFNFSKIYSISITTLFLNGYWYYLLYNNSVTSIEWGFVFKLTNIYLQLAPFLIANVLLMFIYSKSKKTILKIL
jgi:hypothetical protein